MRPLEVGAVLAVLALAALAWGERPGRKGWRSPRQGAPAVVAYVTYNGFHSDLVLSERALQAYGMEGPTVAAMRRLAPSPWLAVGWGDMRFYRGEGFGLTRAGDLVRAAFWPGNLATVHLQRSGDPERKGGDWEAVRLRLSPSDFEAMVRRIDSSFALQDGQPIAGADALGPQEVYFNGRGGFFIGHDCNHWIGDAVGAAGAPHNRVLDTFSSGLSLDLRLRAGAARLYRSRTG